MDQQKCRICGERHRLGPCPSTASSSGARRVADRQLPTPTAPPPKGGSRDSVQASGAEDGIALQSTTHPKGAGLKRGRPTNIERARRAAATEMVEIEIPNAPVTQDRAVIYGTASLVFFNADGSTRDATPEEIVEFVRRSDDALYASFAQTESLLAKPRRFDKKTYQRELMRRRRLKARQKQDKTQ